MSQPTFNSGRKTKTGMQISDCGRFFRVTTQSGTYAPQPDPQYYRELTSTQSSTQISTQVSTTNARPTRSVESDPEKLAQEFYRRVNRIADHVTGVTSGTDGPRTEGPRTVRSVSNTYNYHLITKSGSFGFSSYPEYEFAYEDARRANNLAPGYVKQQEIGVAAASAPPPDPPKTRIGTRPPPGPDSSSGPTCRVIDNTSRPIFILEYILGAQPIRPRSIPPIHPGTISFRDLDYNFKISSRPTSLMAALIFADIRDQRGNPLPQHYPKQNIGLTRGDDEKTQATIRDIGRIANHYKRYKNYDAGKNRSSDPEDSHIVEEIKRDNLIEISKVIECRSGNETTKYYILKSNGELISNPHIFGREGAKFYSLVIKETITGGQQPGWAFKSTGKYFTLIKNSDLEAIARSAGTEL